MARKSIILRWYFVNGITFIGMLNRYSPEMERLWHLIAIMIRCSYTIYHVSLKLVSLTISMAAFEIKHWTTSVLLHHFCPSHLTCNDFKTQDRAIIIFTISPWYVSSWNLSRMLFYFYWQNFFLHRLSLVWLFWI